MQVTRIEPHGKNRFKIYLNDEFAFLLYRGELRLYRIEEGEELPESARKEILEKVLKKRARLRAMHLLEKADKTEQQLSRKLLMELYPSEAVEDAVAYVKSYRYVDDASYAERYVEQKLHARSRRQMEADLLARGIDRETVRETLKRFPSNEEELLMSLIRKKYPCPEKLDEAAAKKLSGYLMRKGFSYEDISKGIEKARHAGDQDEQGFW